MEMFAKCAVRITDLFSVEDNAANEWRRQNAAFDTNPMYQLIYLAGKGRLVEAYEKRANDAEFREEIRKAVPEFLYNGGEGKLITRVEFAHFRKHFGAGVEMKERCDKMTTQQLLREFNRMQTSDIQQFREHEACWDLGKRGEAGETILHICYLNNTEPYFEIARLLLEEFPKLALDIYEGREYYGESALHFAIINNNLDVVKLLVDRFNAKLDQRATGKFFRPCNQEYIETDSETPSNESHSYYGEYPLAFAASMGNTEIYDYLIEQSLGLLTNGGAESSRGSVDPNAQDSYGNTVVHMVIIHNQKHMMSHVINHSKMPARYDIYNEAGLTPLELSYRLGRADLFATLLDLGSETQWRYGNVAAVVYPLPAIDSIGPNGELNKRSALRMIVQGSKIQHLKMLEGQVIHRLLEEKWNRYAKGMLRSQFCWTILYLILLSLVVLLRPSGELWTHPDVKTMIRYVAEVGVVCGCGAIMLYTTLEIFARGSCRSYFSSLTELPEKGSLLLSVVMTTTCVPCRLLNWRAVEDMLLTMCVPLAWSYLVHFYRVHRKLGPLVVMIGKMCRGDLLKFTIMYGICIYMFATVFYYGMRDVERSHFTTWKRAMETTFYMTYGRFHHADMKFFRVPITITTVFVIFSLLIPVLLLNMLIAKMARTFEKIKDRSRMEWKRQWAMIILNLERSLSQEKLTEFQRAYSTEVRIKKSPEVRTVFTKLPPKRMPTWNRRSSSKGSSRRLRFSLSKDSSNSDSIPPSPPFQLTSFESVDEVRPEFSWRRVSIFPPPPPPTVGGEESSSPKGEMVDCRALLVIKALPKAWLQTKKEIMHKWKASSARFLHHHHTTHARPALTNSKSSKVDESLV
ncbi:transient receptor potential cation channel subfamily V member 5-like [Amphiura filiformis]|uniref:transient receptor potential cation channel subfamily V member 5-like n=1 Tax=Amphiura filiformis TaxID=82378 RepID=UPI003B21CFDE